MAPDFSPLWIPKVTDHEGTTGLQLLHYNLGIPQPLTESLGKLKTLSLLFQPARCAFWNELLQNPVTGTEHTDNAKI